LGDVARLLDEGTLSSVDLVEAYIAQIKKHNRSGAKLNPILSLVAENTALEHAKALDQERAAGKVRSRVHGVPFLVKVLRNTWGSFATS
jgi:amidase